ncbi:hypothetical protein TCAL_07021 [Tigriopus californicus]|uniref:Invertebrate defensins family profile domain-containing protein n=1 Tax=Tigriopus californicus TaxID=6832 RepID=A0A553PDN1_TIGCA|nr:hypothetical protein TCAL_07021 [Tigriopus californicus]|eukprot:TCALIF_07021-PA protein Name:"Protein of unknown function" AED:0.03 eAED:0.03 QI:75/0.66/0.75/1/0.66/0.75/4/202/215
MASPKLTLLSLAFFLSICPNPIEGIRFRCGILAFFGNDRACRASCWVVGRKTGFCDEVGNCNCQEEDLDLRQSIDNLLGGLDVVEYVEMKYSEFKDEVNTWDFCEASCHSIGRVTGQCNADNTDCACADETVSAKQYALCLDDGVCSLYCQREGKARGHCHGPTGWDCRCYSNKEDRPEDEYEFTVPQIDVVGESIDKPDRLEDIILNQHPTISF